LRLPTEQFAMPRHAGGGSVRFRDSRFRTIGSAVRFYFFDPLRRAFFVVA